MLGFLKQIYRNRSEPVDPDLQELVVRAESEEHVIELIMERAEEEIDLPPDDRSGGPPPVPLG